MLRFELRRLDPVRTANISAVVQAAIILAFMLLLSPIFLIVVMIGASQDAEALFGIIPMLLIMVVYPILGLIFGWIGGFLAAVIYNFVIRFTGGLILEFQDLGMGVSPVGAPQPPQGGAPPAANIGA